MTRHLKLAHSASGTTPVVRPDSGQSPVQPPPAEQRRAPKMATRVAKPRAWDPVLDLSGLLWIVHPNDAIIIGGTHIDSIVDRKGGRPFAATGAGSRMPLNTTERPGHYVAQNAGGDFLQCADATLANAIAGDVDCTAFIFASFANFSSAAVILSHSNSGGSEEVSFESQSGASNGFSLTRDGATSSNLAVATARSTSTWMFVMWTYTASTRTWESFIDNVSRGTNTFGASIAPASLTQVRYGAGPTNDKTGFYSVAGVSLNMSADDRAELYDWVLEAA